MRFTLSPVAPLSGEAVLPLYDAKAHLRVVDDNENGVIAGARDAAVDWVEQFCGVALAPRAFVWRAKAFPAEIELPVRPVTAVSAISYRDPDGVAIALSGGAYRLAGDRVVPATGQVWPATCDDPDAVAVTFTAGYTNPAAAPALLSAVKLMLGQFFVHREAVAAGSLAEIPMGVKALCRPYRFEVV